MKILVSHLATYVPGVKRFLLSKNRINTYMKLPDLMRERLYTSQTMIQLEKYILPKRFDIIEYDSREDEWFIVKDVRIW